MDIRNYLFGWKLNDDFINKIETFAVWSSDPVNKTFGRNGLFVTKNNEVFAVGELINKCYVYTTPPSPNKDETKGLFQPMILRPLCNQRIKKFAITHDHVFICTDEGAVVGYGHYNYRNEEGYNKPCKVTQLSDQRVVDIAVSSFENSILVLTENKQVYHWILMQSKEEVSKLELKAWRSKPIGVFSGSKLADFFILLQNGKVIKVSNRRLETVYFQNPIDKDYCKFVKMACGFSHVLLLSTDGRLFVTGSNAEGQLGLGENKIKAERMEHNSFFTEKIVDIAATPSCSLSAVMTESRQIYMFGLCRGMAIYEPTLTSCSSFQEVFFLYSVPFVTYDPVKTTELSIGAHRVKTESTNDTEPQPIDSLYKFKKGINNFMNEGFFNGLSSSPVSVDKLCDFVIIIEGVKIPVHKTVLALRCEHFAEMFRQNTTEEKPGIVEISEGDIRSYLSFLKFIYTDEIDKTLSADEILGLFNLATKYRVKSLAERCSLLMMQPEITIDNVISCYESVAVMNKDSNTKHISENLKELCLSFAAKNETAVITSEEFKKLKPDVAKDFIMEVFQRRPQT